MVGEWGSASSRDGGLVVGTPSYMSPEQARGEDVDARSDLFGAGVLIYECLSGTNPFHASGATDDHPPSSFAPIETIPPKLWSVIARALAERPEDRFTSAAEMARALREAVHPSRSPRRPGGARLPLRIARLLDFCAMVVVAAALGFQVGVPLTSAQEGAPAVAPNHGTEGRSPAPALHAARAPEHSPTATVR